jgi:hypothetical protein
MKKPSVSQEALKLIATITMLIDHIGAVLVYSLYLAGRNTGNYELANRMARIYEPMRIIGRIAFPIYCFLLVEGFHHTRNQKKYVNRMVIGMLLSEIPFDLAISGQIDWSSSSVMVTLLLGILMMAGMGTLSGFWKLLAIPPFYFLAELLGTDYGGQGILLIAMLELTRGLPREKLLRTLGFAVLLWFGPYVQVGPFAIPMEEFALIVLIPMFLYDGRKLTRNKWIQWGFYLFYPVHLLLLWIVQQLLIG